MIPGTQGWLQGSRAGCRTAGICENLGLLTNTWAGPVLSLENDAAMDIAEQFWGPHAFISP